LSTCWLLRRHAAGRLLREPLRKAFRLAGIALQYTAETLPPFFGVLAAWGLLLAYLATGASVAGGALYYATCSASNFSIGCRRPSLANLRHALVAGFIAYRDVKLSAESCCGLKRSRSASFVIVLILLPVHLGSGSTPANSVCKAFPELKGLGPALVLSIFSFAGFESATTLGGEARDPLKTIPRAVLQCALLAGVFFMLCAYSEVVGFRGESTMLSDTTSPLHLLSAKAGRLAARRGHRLRRIHQHVCVRARLLHSSRARAAAHGARWTLLPQTHSSAPTSVMELRELRSHFPPRLMFALHGGFALRGATGSDHVRLDGIAFGLRVSHCVRAGCRWRCLLRGGAGPALSHRRSPQHLTVAVMILIAIFDLNSAADTVHARIPYLYLVYIAAGLGWYGVRRAIRANR
jgi:hypothetical protein